MVIRRKLSLDHPDWKDPLPYHWVRDPRDSAGGWFEMTLYMRIPNLGTNRTERHDFSPADRERFENEANVKWRMEWARLRKERQKDRRAIADSFPWPKSINKRAKLIMEANYTTVGGHRVIPTAVTQALLCSNKTVWPWTRDQVVDLHVRTYQKPTPKTRKGKRCRLNIIVWRAIQEDVE